MIDCCFGQENRCEPFAYGDCWNNIVKVSKARVYLYVTELSVDQTYGVFPFVETKSKL